MNKKILMSVGLGVITAAGGAIYAGVGTGGEAVAETVATIYRAPGCGCCDAYANYLDTQGFEVEVVDDARFDERSIAAGVPKEGLGCHLVETDGYVVSGLVPADIIERLLQERPAVTGITLPGMPANAPGMAPVKTGRLQVYAFGPEGVSVFSHE